MSQRLNFNHSSNYDIAQQSENNYTKKEIATLTQYLLKRANNGSICNTLFRYDECFFE